MVKIQSYVNGAKRPFHPMLLFFTYMIDGQIDQEKACVLVVENIIYKNPRPAKLKVRLLTHCVGTD
jgi:hypothetical protein